jgi:acetyl-CoA acetyltransferase
VGTVTPDMMFPSTACLVQDKIGAKGAWGFDVSAGCSGFVFALQAGVKLVESGAHKKVLVMRRGRQYADDGLHRPDHLRAVWRRRRGGAAGAGGRGRDRVHRLCGTRLMGRAE